MNRFLQTREEIETWLEFMQVRYFTINDNLTVDVDDNVDLSYVDLMYLPVQFNKVNGWFACYRTKLLSLKGSPKQIETHFYCDSNELISLTGITRIIPGNLNCTNNKLNTLIDGPKEVGGDFICGVNNLTTLTGLPNFIGGIVEYLVNPIKSIKGFEHYQLSNSNPHMAA